MGDMFSNLASMALCAIAASTIFQLIKDRACILRDDLREEERNLAWRMVIFLILPAIVALDLKTTIIAAEWCGGWVKDWSYGILWFEAIPRSLPDVDLLIPVLFVGVAMQFSLAVLLLPALFFRPHPFVATVIGYTISAIFGFNLILDPIISLFGAGTSRWQLAYSAIPKDQLMVVIGVYACAAVSMLLLSRSKALRLWFADLSRPLVAEELRSALYEAKTEPASAYRTCRLAILLERAGMRSQAAGELHRLRATAAGSLYLYFLEPFMMYRRRRYDAARAGFERAAAYAAIPETMRASFFAAAACSSFADGDTRRALNLCERALEFDAQCLIARMVKVDAYLRNGNKEQAGEEVLAAMKQGLDFDVEDKIPMDPETTIGSIAKFEKSRSEGVLDRAVPSA
jgi:hypothetical protein